MVCSVIEGWYGWVGGMRTGSGAGDWLLSCIAVSVFLPSLLWLATACLAA